MKETLLTSIARREGRTKSELFRDMVRVYREQRELEAFEELAEYGRSKAEQRGIRTEKDVERLIDETRGSA